MSGGVDSSVAALLLMRAGYQVLGATMETAYGDAAAKAARVCAELGVAHHLIDVREPFRRQVVEPFIAAYAAGITPNPCVLCNAAIKFPLFEPLMDELDCDWFATGHYVRKRQIDGRWLLQRAAFAAKDQSYFLYRLPQQTIAQTLFPLGELSKERIRELAEEAGLSSSSARDSFDICFIPDGDYRSFLAAAAPPPSDSAGDVVDSEGRVLGRHRGLSNYTVGQRRGVDIALGYPAYVISIDNVNNRLVLGDKQQLYAKTMRVGDLCWLAGDAPPPSFDAEVKVRYKSAAKAARCSFERQEGVLCVEFAAAERAVAPGQSAVFYNGDAVLGGGIIL